MTLSAKPAKVRRVVALTSSNRTGDTSREDIVGHVNGVDAEAELDSTAIEAQSRHLQLSGRPTAVGRGRSYLIAGDNS